VLLALVTLELLALLFWPPALLLLLLPVLDAVVELACVVLPLLSLLPCVPLDAQLITVAMPATMSKE
jgi:hypothetical protein